MYKQKVKKKAPVNQTEAFVTIIIHNYLAHDTEDLFRVFYKLLQLPNR